MKNKVPAWQKQGFKNVYEYQLYRVQQRGFKTIAEYNNFRLKQQGHDRGMYDYFLANGILDIVDQNKVKDYYEDKCPTAVEIPDIPGYFITPLGEIWKCRTMFKGDKWHIIKQQAHKSGYKAFQPYLNGKRCVKYVHRALCSAFYGARDASYEAHHKNGNTHDNTLDNLVWVERDKHRAMPRGKRNKHKRRS